MAMLVSNKLEILRLHMGLSLAVVLDMRDKIRRSINVG